MSGPNVIEKPTTLRRVVLRGPNVIEKLITHNVLGKNGRGSGVNAAVALGAPVAGVA
ncbi:hypothetical protein NSS64_05520 [Paenibacillus sp. FSL H8-0122]|uniref:hypothetical protein n=1 Tax=Paenibacillus sp. FSL H8-0122 TaxID=2954510 RepID=UPI0030F5FD44